MKINNILIGVALLVGLQSGISTGAVASDGEIWTCNGDTASSDVVNLFEQTWKGHAKESW